MKQLLILLFFPIVAFLYACSDVPKEVPASNKVHVPDSVAECEAEVVKDPNDPKPMALMMRQMAANADSIRSGLLRGEQMDSTRYPFIRFYLVEPTDPDVLQPEFFENARLFQIAYRKFFQAQHRDTRNYNAIIDKCVNCHESYCSGPLKRIRKLYIK